jgi:AcrR family transcriptional regulator
MAPEQTIFQRARRPEHKQQRYDAILTAARALALQNSVRDVSLADIAAEVGMHKSALLRYFTTRDEIYLHLAAQDWQDWAEAIARALADAPTGSTADVAAGLHQVVHPPPTLAALYREDPQLGHANVEFAASLQRITEVILLGFEHRHARRAPLRRVDPEP